MDVVEPVRPSMRWDIYRYTQVESCVLLLLLLFSKAHYLLGGSGSGFEGTELVDLET